MSPEDRHDESAPPMAGHVMFYVHDRPQVWWDWELSSKNLAFLRGVDADYYTHVVEAHAPYLEGDSRMQAAAALRLAYSQGLETLMALLCAAMQAPQCVVGWMLSYRDSDLQSMVRSVSSRHRTIVLPPFQPATWDSVAKHVHSGVAWDKEKKACLAQGFGRLWSRFAGDYLDELGRQEYNALKHGTRPRLGGFQLAIGLQPSQGVPAPYEAMHSMGGSEFGSTFFVAERLGGDKLHCRPKRVSRNWVPENVVNGLGLLAMSIRNVTSFLRWVNGEQPQECRFEAPTEETAFDLPWAQHCGVTSSSMDTTLRVEHVNLFTKEEVLTALRCAYGELDGPA
jgi:hypothetical protein